MNTPSFTITAEDLLDPKHSMKGMESILKAEDERILKELSMSAATAETVPPFPRTPRPVDRVRRKAKRKATKKARRTRRQREHGR